MCHAPPSAGFSTPFISKMALDERPISRRRRPTSPQASHLQIDELLSCLWSRSHVSVLSSGLLVETEGLGCLPPGTACAVDHVNPESTREGVRSAFRSLPTASLCTRPATAESLRAPDSARELVASWVSTVTQLSPGLAQGGRGGLWKDPDLEGLN